MAHANPEGTEVPGRPSPLLVGYRRLGGKEEEEEDGERGKKAINYSQSEKGEVK